MGSPPVCPCPRASEPLPPWLCFRRGKPPLCSLKHDIYWGHVDYDGPCPLIFPLTRIHMYALLLAHVRAYALPLLLRTYPHVLRSAMYHVPGRRLHPLTSVRTYSYYVLLRTMCSGGLARSTRSTHTSPCAYVGKHYVHCCS